jgi:hypothetical protein
MTDLLKLPYLHTVSSQDNGDYYRVTAEGTLEPSACSSCGHNDFYV